MLKLKYKTVNVKDDYRQINRETGQARNVFAGLRGHDPRSHAHSLDVTVAMLCEAVAEALSALRSHEWDDRNRRRADGSYGQGQPVSFPARSRFANVTMPEFLGKSLETRCSTQVLHWYALGLHRCST
jgi:hypothetical protein